MKDQKNEHCRYDDLIAFYYGEIDNENGRKLERHLECCEDCRRLLAETERLLGGIETPVLSLSSADIERFADRVTNPGRRPMRHVVAWVGSLAVLAVFLFAPDFMPQKTQKTVESPRPSQEMISVDPELLENMELLQNLELLEYMAARESMGKQG